MAECSVCGEGNKRLYCGACTSHLTLRARINVTKVALQLAQLRQNVRDGIAEHPRAGEGNEARTGLLAARISALQQRVERTHQSTLACHNEALQLRKQAQTLRAQIASQRTASAQRQKMAANARTAHSTTVSQSMAALEDTYMHAFKASLSLQLRCCHDLLEIFVLKKKRRKSGQGYEIVLGFNVVPELSHLGHYSVPTINSGLERVAYFAVLLASYLGVRLPCEIMLPHKAQPQLQVGGKPLYITHSVKTLMRSSPTEFHDYCRVLAMLALNIAHLATKLGVPMLSSGGTPAVTRLGQLIAQIYLRLESLIKSGHQIQVHTGSVGTDVDTLQDQLITVIDVDVNGHSAEWNIVDVPNSPV